MVISGVELHKWVNQNKIIETSRIKQIYRFDKKELLFTLNTKEGNKYLVVSIPNYIFLSDNKPESETKETGFGRWMRSNLKGGVISLIEQVKSERILKIVVKDFEIYFEFFGKGNIVVVQNGQIVITLEKQEMKERNLIKGETYEIPESLDTFNATEEQINELIKDSDLNASKFFATKLNLGGKVAEWLCDELKIDINDKLSKINTKDVIKAIQKIISEETDFSKFEKEFESKPKETAYSKKIKKIETIIDTQKQTLKKVEEDIVKYNDIGEFIYNNYSFFEELTQAFEYASKNNKEINSEVVDKLKKKHNFKADIKYKKPEVEIEYAS